MRDVIDKQKNKNMAIPENQLITWSNQGAAKSSASTYESICNCIDRGGWNSDVNYKTYLQGSYKNTTNIHGNSDVDIICEFMSIYSHDTSDLDDIGKSSFDSQFTPAQYTLTAFKKAIVKQLESCYGKKNIDVESKAIKIKGNGSRLDADVVVCNPYRKYKKNNSNRNIDYAKGILFNEEDMGKTIINYPIPHYDNGVDKNKYSRTYSNLKKVTRVFKNMKASLVNNQAMSSKTSPSYFVECLLFNAKDEHFCKSSFTDMVVPIINQFNEDDKSNACDKYVCQNYQRWLFGSGDQQWNRAEAKEYIEKLIYVWNNYPI
jgi:hypothetical protein